MTVSDLVAELEARGITLEEDGPNLVVGPKTALTEQDLAQLRILKPDVLALLRHRNEQPDVLRMSLYALDRVLELEVPGWDFRLLIAPGCRIARELRAQDASPGRVWCKCEVLDLLLTNVPPSDARKIAEARFLFDATLEAVWKPS